MPPSARSADAAQERLRSKSQDRGFLAIDRHVPEARIPAVGNSIKSVVIQPSGRLAILEMPQPPPTSAICLVTSSAALTYISSTGRPCLAAPFVTNLLLESNPLDQWEP